METKFTKGQWEIGAYLESVRIENDDRYICEIDCDFDHVPQMSEEDRANAHLIAAAPEMYDLLASIENDGRQVPDWLWNKIQGTLARARGEKA